MNKTEKTLEIIQLFFDQNNDNNIKNLDAKFEQKILNIERSKNKIKILEHEEPENKEEREKQIEIFTVGKIECINEGGNYFKLVNGKKCELYAETKNGKVFLHKKSIVKKIEIVEDDMDVIEKELNNIPKMKKK